MGVGMNHDEATRIAGAINFLRPDWGRAGLLKLMENDYLAARPGREVALALTFVACDPASRAPTRVLEHGPWWELNIKWQPAAPAYRYPAHDDCHDCGRPKAVHPTHDCRYVEPVRVAAPMPTTVRDALRATTEESE